MTSLKLIASAKANGTVPVYKYESQSTGLKVVLANVEGKFLVLCMMLYILTKSVYFKVLFAVATSFLVSLLLHLIMSRFTSIASFTYSGCIRYLQ